MIITEQHLKNLQVPDRPVDVVLDTDAYNEIDDQFAIAYLLRSNDKLRTKAIYAAPYWNRYCQGPKDGMEKSFMEIQKVLCLLGEETVPAFKGSETYLPNEEEPVISPAALDLADRAMQYSPENPLYVIAIGTITNIASAILINPKIQQNIVVVWLSGNAHHFHNTDEFNMKQDIAAARVVMGGEAPFIQLPCMGVVSGFIVSEQELQYWLAGKNPLCDYLVENTIANAKRRGGNRVWSRAIWDVTAVAWLLNERDRFMLSRVEPVLLPTYERVYESDSKGTSMRYVYHIKRDALMEDLFEKLTKQ